MRSKTSPRFALPSLLTIVWVVTESVASAQNVVVVDPGGAGDFLDVRQAVANSGPGTTVLIREGVYFDFLNPAPALHQVSIQRGVILQADAGASVLIGPVVIEGLPANESVLVRGLDIVPFGFGFDATVLNAAGPVVFEDCEFLAGGSAVQISGGVDCRNSASLTLVECTVVRSEGTLAGCPASICVEDSSLAVFGGSFEGLGSDLFLPVEPGAAFQLTNSTLQLSASEVQGGAGASGPFVDCAFAGGAAGIELLGGSVLTEFGAQLSGGAGAPAAGSCPAGTDGVAVAVEAGSVWNSQPQTLGAVDITAVARVGEIVTDSFSGAPGDLVWLLFSQSPTTGLQLANPFGQLWIDLPVVLIPLGSLDAAGQFDFVLPAPGLPIGFDSLTFVAQSLNVDPVTLQARLGNPSIGTILAPTF